MQVVLCHSNQNRLMQSQQSCSIEEAVTAGGRCPLRHIEHRAAL